MERKRDSSHVSFILALHLNTNQSLLDGEKDSRAIVRGFASIGRAAQIWINPGCCQTTMDNRRFTLFPFSDKLIYHELV